MKQKEQTCIDLKTDRLLDRVNDLVERMTLSEKIGQMSQVTGMGGLTDNLRLAIQQGKVGSILNEVGLESLNEIQRIAMEESRLGIPLLIGRDVIHGFRTMLPIPLGQAASWNPELIKKGARMAAIEAASEGINWTFAPMIDITRDPRWGRIAETLGEDTHLTSVLGTAMVEGFQGEKLSQGDSIAACVKHYAGYGYSESGKDYAYVNISESELRNVVLPPFRACVDAGVATLMTAFSDLNGIPASGNEFLLKKVLREEWGFSGFVVSDWDAVKELKVHGFAEDNKMAAFEALQAGVDMEMVSTCYQGHIATLLREGLIEEKIIDQYVRNILRVKFELGLFENPYTKAADFPVSGNPEFLQIAKQAALESCVLLKNDYDKLPLRLENIQNLAIIGPMADDAYEQMGTWTFDGKEEWCQTPLQAIRAMVGDRVNIHVAKGLETTRTKNRDGFEAALEAARKSDTVLLFMGEEAILSGEAHCRADINLPGFQNELLKEIAQLGKSTVLVIMAGRPLTLGETKDYANALLYAWHPGTMGGPAIADLIFGKASPVGKTPVTFPKVVGQIPIYYNQRNTGRPTREEDITFMNDIPVRAAQTSLGNTSFHLDAGLEPLYPFGFGLSYTTFHYHNIQLSAEQINLGETLEIKVELSNTGSRAATEITQLYVRDIVGNITRPIRELKGFQQVHLAVGETKTIAFQLHTKDLAFYNRKMDLVTEPGQFNIWVGGDSNASLQASFWIKK